MKSSSYANKLLSVLVSKILAAPFIWDISQFIFGCNKKKMQIYRSAFEKPEKILDFGCANGNTFLAFQDFEYYGLDTDKKMIDYASKRYSSFKNAHFVNADILNRPFLQNSFDSVLFAMTGHHLENELFLKIMKAFGEALKVDGHLHIFDTIRRPEKDSALLRFLISLDQGKFMKTENWYKENINRFSGLLKPVEIRTFNVKGTFMPQPTYLYAKLRKVDEKSKE